MITWEGERPNPTAITEAFNRRLDLIEKGLEYARNDIAAHNGNLRNQIPGLLTERRARLLSDRQVHASIDFPILRRSDADTYAIPVRRQLLVPARRPSVEQSGPFQPQTTLPEDGYEAALAVLRNARNAFERSPSLTQKLGEEMISDLLLILLNAQFEGKAGGELFNCGGKTDILIRDNDTNIFIAECKIYGPKDGPKKVTDTIDQLLRYLTWRDTKAAILLFVRNQQVTTVVAKAIEQFERHPNFKRPGRSVPEERYDFVLHANGDQSREMNVAFLPFLVGGSAAR